MKFVEDAKKELRKYIELKEKYDELMNEADSLKKEMDDIKHKFDRWLNLNGLNAKRVYTILNDPETNTPYKIERSTKRTKKVNTDMLRAYVSPEVYDQLVVENESEPFIMIRKLKVSSLL